MPRHAETRQMPYQARQMYDLVGDVASYPQFLPWCAAARVTSVQPCEGGHEVTADLVVSFKVFREKFASKVGLQDDLMTIETEYLDGPFKYMQSTWSFVDREGGGCNVSFFVDFEFKNRVLQGIIGVVFNEAMHRIVRAFEVRAEALYGAKPDA
ncbi:MAG: coenzyme Q-binding protein COQ10 [Sulfitobacter sp.]|jgi:coenzyme Q-binding protein COQ10